MTRLLIGMIFAMSPMSALACTGVTQLELNQCAADDYTRADAELNLMWSPAKASADATGAGALLLEAQRKWIAYRDAACAAEAAPYAGGSIQPQVYSTCLSRLTRHRTYDLRAFLY